MDADDRPYFTVVSFPREWTVKDFEAGVDPPEHDPAAPVPICTACWRRMDGLEGVEVKSVAKARPSYLYDSDRGLIYCRRCAHQIGLAGQRARRRAASSKES